MRVKFKQWHCIAEGTYYAKPDKARAILLWEEFNAKADHGSLIATATVNMPIDIPDDCVFIKNYSENIGMTAALIQAGIIHPDPVKTIQSTFVDISAHRLTEPALKTLWKK